MRAWKQNMIKCVMEVAAVEEAHIAVQVAPLPSATRMR